MKRFLLPFSILFLAGSLLAQAKTINLAWDDTQTGVKHRVYHKTSATASYVKDCAAAATVNCRDAGTANTFAWTGAAVGAHYFVVTAYMPDPVTPTVELESPYSNEVNTTVAPAPPTTLRVVSQTAEALRKTATLTAETNLPAKATLSYALGGLYWASLPQTKTFSLKTVQTVWNTRPHSYYRYKWNLVSEDGQVTTAEGDFTTQ